MDTFRKIVNFFPLFFLFINVSGQNDDADKIQFWFYPNSSNVSDRHEFKLDDLGTITNSSFSRNKPVKVLIHGATANCVEPTFPLNLLEAYLKVKSTTNADYNVICVDWGPLAALRAIRLGEPVEDSIFRNTRLTGRLTAQLLKTLKDNGFITTYSDVHVIGLSLGAHTSGIVGLNIQQSNNFTEALGRVSGIDPAGLFYRSRPIDLDEQLDLSDANFVDVTHTNDKQVGLEGKYGHADFYPDGGEHQSACSRRGFATVVEETIIGRCSHLIGPEYWVTSILYRNVTACKSKSYTTYKKSSKCAKEEELVYFGDNAPTNLFGKYYFET